MLCNASANRTGSSGIRTKLRMLNKVKAKKVKADMKKIYARVSGTQGKVKWRSKIAMRGSKSFP